MAIKSYLTQGKAHYAKIVGKPQPGYGTEPGNGPLEWTFDLEVDKAEEKKLLALGVHKSYIKESRDGSYRYVRFTRKAVKQDGTNGKPYEIIDHGGRDWDGRLIGNGSTLNVNFTLNEVKKDKFKPSALSLQVWDLVPYKSKSAFPTKEAPQNDSSDGVDWKANAEAEAE